MKICTEVSQHKRKRTSWCAFQSAEKIISPYICGPPHT